MVKSLAAFWQRYRFPISLALALRVGLSAWLALVWLVLDPYFPRTAITLRETYGGLLPQPTLLGRALLDVWLRWDAVHYMNIARQGYAGVGRADTNFAPLYSYLVLYLKPLFGGGELVTGLLLSTIMTVLACMAFYRLVQVVFQDEPLARWTTLVWGIYPASFFLFAPFTEALFSALAVGCLLCLYRRQWLWSGLLASLAGLARQQGVLLIVPMFVFAVQHFRDDHTPLWRRLVGFLLAPMGYLGFLAWRSQQGLPFITDSFSQYSRIIFLDPLSGYFSALGFAISRLDPLALTEILSVSLFLGLTVWMFFQPRFRPQLALLAYNLACLALFLSKHTQTATPIQSANRYVISLYPAFIGLAALLLGWPARARRVYVLVSLAGWLVASTLYAMWIFVG